MKTTTKTPHVGTHKKVLEEVARRMNVTPREIIECNKKMYITNIRYLYCKLRYEAHGMSYAEIGREINRNPATVKYGVSRFNEYVLQGDEKLVAMWESVQDILGEKL